MSVKKKIPPRKYHEQLTVDQERHLLMGWTFDVCEPAFGRAGYPFRDDAHRREIWSRSMEYLMAKTPPGTRCDAWWTYEAPEPRHLLSGTYEAFDNVLYRGKPCHFAKMSYPFPVWESELEYLKRLNLLAEVEQKIGADAPEINP
jgi:hypothetical protein